MNPVAGRDSSYSLQNIHRIRNFYQATGGQWIYKLNASKTKAIRVPLSIGRQNPQQYEITDGLQPGDWVITTGYDNFGEAEELILK